MTREEAINKWIIPAIRNTWNAKKCKEILEALEQEPTTKTCKTCRNFGSHHGICEICKDNRCWIEKEPTTRNCFGCKYSKDNHNAGTEECHLCMWENQYTPITKNNLTDYLSRAEMVKYQEYLDGKISNDCVRFR